MLRLFFDTETTGMWDRYQPPMYNRQPVFVQLAYILMEDDTEREAHTWLAQPVRDINPGAAAVHGITPELAEALGHPTHRPLEAFLSTMAMLNEGDEVVGHNVEFDLNVIRATCWAIDKGSWAGRMDEILQDLKVVCTMQATTPICKIPSMYPKPGDPYKWPKLIEAYRHFYGKDFEGAHDAMADVRATIAVYQAINNPPAAAAVAS